MYNGYKDYTTWRIIVAMENDETLYKHYHEVAEKMSKSEFMDYVRKSFEDLGDDEAIRVPAGGG